MRNDRTPPKRRRNDIRAATAINGETESFPRCSPDERRKWGRARSCLQFASPFWLADDVAPADLRLADLSLQERLDPFAEVLGRGVERDVVLVVFGWELLELFRDPLAHCLPPRHLA